MEQTVENWLKEASRQLKTIGLGTDLAWAEALLMLSHISGRQESWLVAHQEKTLLPQTKTKLKHALSRRLKHEPMAYIIGTQPFCGNEIYTDHRALIPRPETEDMTLEAINAIRNTDGRTLVWDVGTGSGAIAVSVALACPNARVLATDVRRGALNLATKNAESNRLHNMTFLRSNLMGKHVISFLKSKKFDTLFTIANLPYLPPTDKKKLMKDVIGFEPWSALFAKKKGLDLNQHLLEELAKWFHAQERHNLSLFMEFDPPQSKTLREKAAALFPHAKVRVNQDACGRDRYLTIFAVS